MAGRPLHVYSEYHLRAPVFLCMLAYYLEWHMRRRLAPLLFQDYAPAAGQAQRETPVEPAEVSARAQRKAASKTTEEGRPCTASRPCWRKQQAAVTIASEPSRPQRRTFDLLGIDPQQKVSITVTG